MDTQGMSSCNTEMWGICWFQALDETSCGPGFFQDQKHRGVGGGPALTPGRQQASLEVKEQTPEPIAAEETGIGTSG